MTIHPQTDPITIFYPNGGNQAVQMYVWDGVKPILWTGSVTFSGTLNVGVVSGSLTNNNAAPAANNIGVLPAVVSTTNLNYTQGNQALLRVDTTGALVVNATLSTTGLATNAGAANLATAQVTATTTATVIAASRATRRSVTVVNGGTTNVYLGTTGVSTTSGVLLLGSTGAAVTFAVTGTISGIVTSGSQSVSYFEEYD